MKTNPRTGTLFSLNLTSIKFRVFCLSPSITPKIEIRYLPQHGQYDQIVVALRINKEFKQQRFLSDGGQPKVDFLHHWSVVWFKLSGKSSS